MVQLQALIFHTESASIFSKRLCFISYALEEFAFGFLFAHVHIN